MHLLADRQQLTLEVILILDVGSHADNGLLNNRHLGQHCFAQPVGVSGNFTPRNQVLALDLYEVLKLMDGDRAGLFVLGKEAHGHGVFADRRQIDVRTLGPVAQQTVRNLNQNPGTIPYQRVSTHGTAMVQIDENLQTAGHDFMRFAAFDIGHKSYPARVVLVSRIVQTLLLRSAHTRSPLH